MFLGPLLTSNQSQDNLVKLVRGLDQAGPGDNGENLEALWKSLVANPDTRFHAAEESTLRWLLKTMNGTTPAAETMRRYPLTWTLLDCVFCRIPLFSLAKSLADRKFVAVLQQSLKDISKPSTEQPAKTSKRKREQTPTFSLDSLKSNEGCLYTAGSLLKALKSLVRRLQEATTSSSRDQIGAEHIRSLFCNAAVDAVNIVSPALGCCRLLLESGLSAIEGSEFWLKTISDIWDMHLQANADQIEVAIHLFTPSSIILAKLEEADSLQLQSQWKSDLEAFLQQNLIVPARTAYLNREDFDSISQALEVSRSRIECSGPVLYALASSAVEAVLAKERRRHLTEWMKRVFQAIEGCIRSHDDRSELIQKLLRQAIRQSSPVDVKDLRQICKRYGIGADGTNWPVLASIATCDPDTFQPSGDGSELLTAVCERIAGDATKGDDEDQKAMLDVISGIMHGYVGRRDVTSFLKLWFSELCKAEEASTPQSPWFMLTLKESKKSTTSSIIEREMSPQQLSDVIQWVQTENKSCPNALAVIFDAIAQETQKERYVDAVGLKLFEVLWPVCRKDKEISLKWRVARRTIGWAKPEDRLTVWTEIKSQMSKTLQKRPIEAADTFEAFKCCCQTWDYLTPDGKPVADVTKLVEDFTNRLASELLTPKAMELLGPMKDADMDVEELYDTTRTVQQYLSWYLLGCSRLNRLLAGDGGELPVPVANSISSDEAKGDIGAQVWKLLLENDVNLNDGKLARTIIDRILVAFAEASERATWSSVIGPMCIRTLSRVPLDSFNRWQRERIMTILDIHAAKIVKEPTKVFADDWKAVLSLAAKIMSRPTFYESMSFTHLIETATALSSSLSQNHQQSTDALELIARFSSAASLSIRQMADNVDERSLSYFEKCSPFVKSCQKAAQSKSSKIPAFNMTLLKALVAELGASASCQIQPTLSELVDEATEALSVLVLSVVTPFLEEKKRIDERDGNHELQLFAAVDGAKVLGDLTQKYNGKLAAATRVEKKSFEKMQNGDVVAWKLQAFLHTHLPSAVQNTRPIRLSSLAALPSGLQQSLLREFVYSVTKHLSTEERVQYLRDLIVEYGQGLKSNGQILAIQLVMKEIIESSDYNGKHEGFDLSAACSELAVLLYQETGPNTAEICRTIYTLLEKKPQVISQWNVEATLNAVSGLAADGDVSASYTWLCKLIEIIIKKHRLRLESHYHIVLVVLQSLLRRLITDRSQSDDKKADESRAHAYARLVTLICEPTAGAVSRSQNHSSLDSATDAAKRSAGRHMYLILMQYVKLQLEVNVPASITDALEHAMNTIFDITPPEGRKILNDAMDASGRAILREMFKRYVKFGKWTGV